MGGREEARAERGLPLQGERQSGGRPDQKVLVARRDGARRQRAMRCLGRAWGSPISDVFVGAPVFVLEHPVPVVPVVFFFSLIVCVCVCFQSAHHSAFLAGSSPFHTPSPAPPLPQRPIPRSLLLSLSRELAIALPRKSVPTEEIPEEEFLPNQSIFILFIHPPVKTSWGAGGRSV